MASKRRPKVPAGSRADRRHNQHFAALQRESSEHPVDVAVDRMPEIARLRGKLLRRADQVMAKCGDAKLFIAYEDLRSDYCSRREAGYFDCGWDHGRLAGRAESLGASASANPAARELMRDLLVLAAESTLPRGHVVAVVLEMARALAIGMPMRGGGRGRVTAKTGGA